MKKKFWILGVAVVLLLALIVAWRLIMRLPDKDTNSKTKVSETNEKINLVNLSFDKVKEIEINNNSKFKIQISHSENEETNYTIPELDKSKKLSKLNVESAVRVLCSLSATKKVLNKSDKLDDFGLQKPLASVKIISEDNTQVVLQLGKKAPLGDGVYVKKEGEDTIYLITIQNANYFTSDINSYAEQEKSEETIAN